MNQKVFLNEVLSRFGMGDCKPRSTPCEVNVNKMSTEGSVEVVDKRLYRKIVGSLIYAMSATRPDLGYVVTKLSQHLAKPTSAHLTMAKHVLRYVKGTLDHSLVFRKSSEPLKLTGYCDADWATSLDDRRSTTGYCFQLSPDGPMISWKSKKQSTVALSSCEAEYMALASATREAKFLLQLLRDMDGDQHTSAVMHADNQGALVLAKNPVHHQRSKHIDIRYHFIRNEVQIGALQLVYTPSDDNVADLFTKPPTCPKLRGFLCILMGT